MALTLAVGACASGRSLLGHDEPAGTSLGRPVNSGIENFPRPDRLDDVGGGIGVENSDSAAFDDLEDPPTLDELVEWYAAVLPIGEDVGDWRSCPEPVVESHRRSGFNEIRRYESDRGAVQVNLAVGHESGSAVVDIVSFADGDCSSDLHDLRCVEDDDRPDCSRVELETPELPD